MVHVPYRGGGPLMNDALAGHVDLAIGSAALVTPQVSGGKLRGIAQTSATRVPGLPDVPTVIESGFPGFEFYAWWGSFTAGTHAARHWSIASAMRWRRRCASPQIKSRIEAMQITLAARRAGRAAQVPRRPDEALGPGGEGAQHQGG